MNPTNTAKSRTFTYSVISDRCTAEIWLQLVFTLIAPLVFFKCPEEHPYCNTKYDSTCKLNYCLQGVSAKFRRTISYTGRQNAQNVRGHFSKAQGYRSQSSFGSCLATLRCLILIYIYIIFLYLYTHPKVSPRALPKASLGFSTTEGAFAF